MKQNNARRYTPLKFRGKGKCGKCGSANIKQSLFYRCEECDKETMLECSNESFWLWVKLKASPICSCGSSKMTPKIGKLNRICLECSFSETIQQGI